MRELTHRALVAGALGVSTSRTPLHRSLDGEFVPGTFAPTEELLGLARAIAEAGHGVFQCAIHHPDVPDSYDWLRAVAERSGGPVVFNLDQPDIATDLWREELVFLEAAADDGLEILAQVAGRPVGILECWSATVHPFVACAGWREIADLPADEQLARLRDPEVRARITSEEPAELSRFQTFVTRTWDKMWPFAGEADHEPDPADSISAIAAGNGRTPVEIAYDHLCTEDGRAPLQSLQPRPRPPVGAPPAPPHPHGPGRRRGQTRQTAELYGLHDRGLLAPGLRADVNVIDVDNLAVELPRLVNDLPTGARRYVQRARGYRATLCRGEVTVVADEFTGEHPGGLLISHS